MKAWIQLLDAADRPISDAPPQLCAFELEGNRWVNTERIWFQHTVTSYSVHKVGAARLPNGPALYHWDLPVPLIISRFGSPGFAPGALAMDELVWE